MFKRLFILFSLAIVGGFVAGFYFWKQFTTVPDVEQSQTSQIQQQRSQQDRNEEINQVIVNKITERSQSSQLLRSAKSIRANLESDRLEIGGVFNPSEIPNGSLDETQQAILDKAIQTFPQLQNLDIYVGVVGHPKIENGRLILDETNQLKVGKLKFSINEIAQKFGLSADKLQQYLELEIAKLDIQGIKINNDTMTVEVSQ